MGSKNRPQRRHPDNFGHALRRELALTWLARVLMGLGLIIVVQHLFAHAGYRPIPMNMGLQDLIIGYPTASLFFVGGLFIWGRSPKH